MRSCDSDGTIPPYFLLACVTASKVQPASAGFFFAMPNPARVGQTAASRSTLVASRNTIARKGGHMKKLGVSLVIVVLSGCAISPQQFAAQRETLRPDEICRGRSAAVKNGDYVFVQAIDEELSTRGIPPGDCPAIIEKASQQASAAAALILGGLALAAIARSNPGGGGYPYTPEPQDNDWAWDQFYNQYYQLVWACRGLQTGQFANLDRCSFKGKHDSTWPSKRADAR